MKSVSAAADKKVTCVYGIFGSHESRAWRRANGVDIVAIQYETRIGQRIDIGRGNLRRATEAHIVEALQKRERQIKQQLNQYRIALQLLQRLQLLTYQIIGQYENDVGLRNGIPDEQKAEMELKLELHCKWLPHLHCIYAA